MEGVVWGCINVMWGVLDRFFLEMVLVILRDERKREEREIVSVV